MKSAFIRRVAVPGSTAGAAFLIAYDNGGYGLSDRTTLAIASWWAVILLIALGMWPRARLPRSAVVAGGMLAAFAAWALLSSMWAPSAEAALSEFNRTTLYLGVFLLAVAAGSAGRAAPVATGVAVGFVGIAIVAIVSWFFPETFLLRGTAEFVPGARGRLSFPIGYWNGLAVLIGLAWPVLLNLATATNPRVRAFAVAPAPLLGAVAYLTVSRGGVVVVVVGTATFLAFTNQRRLALGAASVAVVGAAAGVVISRAGPEFTGPEGGAATSAWETVVLLAAACGATGVAWAFGSGFLRARLATRPAVLTTFVILAVVGGGAVAASAMSPATSAVSGPAERVPSERGLSGRAELWTAALDQFRSHPFAGEGAGSFESWWTRHGELTTYSRDAHSLYLETLGELGIVGAALLAAALAFAFAGALRSAALHRNGVTAALLAIAVAFAVVAAFDWMWELTVVPIVGIGALGLVLGQSRPDWRATQGDRRPADTRGLALALAVLVGAWAVVCTQAVELLADLQLRASQTAARESNGAEAESHALAARRLTPWAATPRLQLALVAEQAGDLRDARRRIDEALDRSPQDWRLWLAAARIETRAGSIDDARRSLGNVKRLNPRFTLFEEQ